MVEREMAYEPGLVRQIIEADINWTQKNKTRTAERAPDRKFEDTSDGQVPSPPAIALPLLPCAHMWGPQLNGLGEGRWWGT